MSNEMLGPGCSVTILGRSGLRFRDGTRSMLVDGEMVTGKFDFVIYAKSIRNWEGTDQVLSEEQRIDIVKRIGATFAANGLSLDVEA